MSDRNKVIEALEACVLKDPDDSRNCRHCPRCNYGAFITNSCINGVMADALALLKAQEPMEPRVGHDGWYRCGGCNNSLASGERVKNFYGHPWPKYCEECGRKVKWE